MRLINTSTLKLHEFYDNAIPHYAILSHRWENGEVSFQDFQNGKGPSLAGWAKITGCCAQAQRDTWEYAWVDSCCIDKTSSAELSEAINSMFRWYQGAEVCYVYLSDVWQISNSEVLMSQFKGSEWFTRGWTLQELLAPCQIDFFDVNWQQFGTKSSLTEMIATITGINWGQLLEFNPYNTSIAQKMSWASRRQTTRIEDQAYCLMGIFGIFMAPLYGEGSHAFRRLQLEIIKQSSDDSIFAWGLAPYQPERSNLLASSPEGFCGCGAIKKRQEYDLTQSSFTVTNKGLMLEGFAISDKERYADGGQYMLLDCTHVPKENKSSSKVIVVPIRRLELGVSHGNRGNYYVRDMSRSLEFASEVPEMGWKKKAVIYNKLDSFTTRHEQYKLERITILLTPPQSLIIMEQYSTFSKSLWAPENPGTWTLNVNYNGLKGPKTCVRLGDAYGLKFVIFLEPDKSGYRLSCFVDEKSQNLKELMNWTYKFKGDISLIGEGSFQIPGGRVIHISQKRAIVKDIYSLIVKVHITEGEV